MSGLGRYLVPGPGVDLPGLVTDALAEAGYSTVPAEGARLTWQLRAWPAVTGTVAVVEVDGGRDLDLAAELSRITGGFVLAGGAPAHQANDVVVHYAGHRLAGEAEFAPALERIAGWPPAGLDRTDVAGSGHLRVRPPAVRPTPAERPATGRLVQIGVGCGEERLRRAFAAGSAAEGIGWRWRPGRTPEADVPFVLLRGHAPPDPRWLTDLARRSESFVAAVDLDADGQAMTWWWVTPAGELTSGSATNGLEVIAVWADFASVLGTRAGTFTWPTQQLPGGG